MTVLVATAPRAIARKGPVGRGAVVIVAALVPARRERRRVARHVDVRG
jgi:hypothetical protein